MTETIRAFDEAANFYDEWYQTSKGKQVFIVERDAVEALLPDEGIGIEIGAGTGIFAEALTKKSRSVVCLDTSSGMISEAKSRGLTSIIGDAKKLPLRGKILDFAYLITLIEFLESPVEALNEIRDSMKNGGDLVAVTINKDSKWGEYYQKIGREGAPVMSQARFYTQEEVKRMFLEAGWALESFFGTLTKGPDEQKPGDTYVNVTANPGILLIHSRETYT